MKLTLCLNALASTRELARDSVMVAALTGHPVRNVSALLHYAWKRERISRVLHRKRRDVRGRTRETWAYYTKP